MRFLLTILTISTLTASTLAQEEYPHNELTWSTIETPHFLIHYHNGAQRTAGEISRIAEAVYKPVTDLYGHEPDQKVSFIVRDHDDYSNGAAYFFDNRIVIYAPALDFELRGIHPWLWNVVTHEFTHVVQIQTALKFGRRMPAFYLQWLGYEQERRPDVLYGYPNVLVSYPISGFVVPSWFAEGVAQINGPDLGFDYWDSHRDMILRMYMVEGAPLSWEEMAVFGKTSLGNESSYNAGFSLVAYIAHQYGMDKLRAISKHLADPFRVTIDGAIEQALGISGRQVYEEWKADALVRYRAMRDTIGTSRLEGKDVEAEGFGNGFAAFSPNDSALAYVSNKGEDYFGRSSVYIRDRASGEVRKTIPEVRSTLSFSPDGRSLYYSKATRDNANWSLLNDLYRYDIRAEEETRLTTGLRAGSPSLSQDGQSLVYAFGSDGTLNVGICDSAGHTVRQVTRFRDGEQVYTPVWSPDGSTIAFGYSQGQNQSIAFVDTDGTHLRMLPLSGDARTPRFSADGRWLYFAWDSTGIFNIYRVERSTGLVQRVTNVLGGAFAPAVSKGGAVAFTRYSSTGYKLAIVEDSAARVPSCMARQSPGLPPGYHGGGFSETDPPDLASRSYRTVFTSLSLIPVLRIDNYSERGSGFDRVKPGLYVASGDVLDKMSLFGGATINREWERDAFLSIDYRDRLPLFSALGLSPTLRAEIYSISRKARTTFPVILSQVYTVSTDVTYDLLEFDLSLNQPIVTSHNTLQVMYTHSRYRATLEHFYVADPRASIDNQAFTMTYLLNDIVSARWRYDGILPTLDQEINPTGRSISFKYGLELNQYNPEGNYDFSSGIPVPVYQKENFHRLELMWNEHLRLPISGHTLSVGLHGGTIQGITADTIFNFYAGGFIGMKGYPFYSIEGNHLAALNVTYRFPVWMSIDTRVLQFYFSKLYASVFADIGNAWNGPVSRSGAWKRDVGAELRLEASSFYAFPTRFFLACAYGLDKFTRQFRGGTVTYGNEWRFYLGILFGFELTDLVPSARRIANGI